MQDLILDPLIRDFVLLSIVALMLLVSLFRHYVTVTIGNTENKTDLKKVLPAQVLLRTRRIRASANRLTAEAFAKRKTYFVDPQNGFLVTAVPQQSDDPMANMQNLMMDPNAMSSMMKKNMLMVVTNMLFFTWIDRSFAGFIAAKLPFGLTQGFKDMFQRGIDLQGLDVSYVSSLSWYILTLTGLRGITTLILGTSNAADDATLMQQQFGGMSEIQQPPATLFNAEKENFEIIQHQWDLEQTETRLLQKFSAN